MTNTIVRIQSVEITGCRSIEQGRIEFENESALSKETGFLRGNIKGLYGENGSGKTTVLEVFRLLRTLWKGESVSKYQNLLSQQQAAVHLRLFILDRKTGAITRADYSARLAYDPVPDGRPGLSLMEESLETSVKKEEYTKFGPTNRITWYRGNDGQVSAAISPAALAGSIGRRNQGLIEMVAEDWKDRSSLFSGQIRHAIQRRQSAQRITKTGQAQKIESRLASLVDTLQTLHDYACRSICIVDRHLPIREDLIQKSSWLEPLIVEKHEAEAVEKSCQLMDSVLHALVPSAHFAWKAEEYSWPDGTSRIRFSFFTCRNGKYVYLSEESAGILRMITMMGALCDGFNRRSEFLLVDDLDEGLFEPLFGQILEVFKDNGKGQLLFTAHNLRGMEVLSPDDIILSTACLEDRFISWHRPGNNNARDEYYRALALDDSDLALCQKTEVYRIRNAMLKSKAGFSDCR